jgi:hypothetical protein
MSQPTTLHDAPTPSETELDVANAAHEITKEAVREAIRMLATDRPPSAVAMKALEILGRALAPARLELEPQQRRCLADHFTIRV